jgi:hypothetical protein
LTATAVATVAMVTIIIHLIRDSDKPQPKVRETAICTSEGIGAEVTSYIVCRMATAFCISNDLFHLMFREIKFFCDAMGLM